MLALENELLRLQMSEDFAAVTVTDRRRNATWQLDTARMVYRTEAAESPLPLRGGRVTRDGEALVVTFELPEGVVTYRWRLVEGCVEVALDSRAPGATSLPLPGPMTSLGEACELAVPVYQGVLVRDETGTWETRAASGGHGGFSMAMGGLLTARGGLLVAQGSLANWRGVYGAQEGKLYFSFDQVPCEVQGWEQHRVRLYVTEPTVTAVCKQFRADLEARNEIATWEEKLARKPALNDLFGAVMTFTGYNRIPGYDYAAQVRRLKDYGFDTMLLFPVRMCHYSLGFKMGGDDPVWLSDEEIAEIRSIPGARVGPWGWVFEALDDGSEAVEAVLRRRRDGGSRWNWQIDEYQWYEVCTPYQREHIMQRFETDMAAMDWIHFDVNATWPPTPCFDEKHALHGHQPMTGAADVQYVRQLMGPDTVGDRIVSSEGFIGHYTAQYDIGSTKMMPGPNLATKTPVPMTMLVFHDCCVHDWWELQNYNAVPGWPIHEALHGFGLVGTGMPKLKAAVDALAGCPPSLFPFGRQYAWSNREKHETVSHTVQFDDPEVQEALREALPVAKLHAQIGRCALVDFRFLSEDRSLQATRFSDGTQIVANLGPEPREIEGHGLVPGQSWRRG
jgi:hypothetical protein